MEQDENTVRICAGLDVVEAKLIEEMLRENDIEYFSTHNTALDMLGGHSGIDCWVAEKDAERARALVDELEARIYDKEEDALEVEGEEGEPYGG